MINTSVIHILHGREKITIQKHWEETYKDFYDIEQNAIENTKKLINFNEDSTQELDYLTDASVNQDDYLSMMRYVCKNYNKAKNKVLKVFNYNNVKFIIDIKYFFPEIRIELHVKSFVNFDSIRFFLDDIHVINVFDKLTYTKLDLFLRSMTILNKPEIRLLSELSLDKNLIIENRIHTVDYSMLVKNNNVIHTRTQPIVKVKLQDEKPEKIEKQEDLSIKSNKKIINKNINIVRNYVQNPEPTKLEDIIKPVKIAQTTGILKVPKRDDVPAPVVKQIKIKKKI